MEHDARAALEFLRLLYAEGPWHLVAIDPSSRETHGRTFRPGADADLARWLAGHAKWNIYYHVNPATEDPPTKAKKEDILHVAYFHVDVDPRVRPPDDPTTPEAWLAAEAVRVERMVSDPRGIVPPTIGVGSGGGVNGLWRLAEPVPIEGLSAPERIASGDAIARYNVQIERVLHGDHCHNIDRILRVVGTINWPDEGKRKKGRVPTRAQLLWHHPDRVYRLDQFVAAPVQAAGAAGTDGRRVSISGNVQRLRDADELPARLEQRWRELIVHGEIPGEPGRYESDSHALFAACCAMVRAEMSDEQIYAIITDPAFKISRHVMKQRSGGERAALRAIARARDASADPNLDEMNQRHAVVRNIGGKCRVVEFVTDEALRRPVLTKQTFEDIRNSYCNRKVEVGKDEDGQPVRAKLGHWWLEHDRRLTYDKLVFSPGRDVPGALNLWQGFAVEAIPGDKHESYLAHVLRNICAGREDYYEYLLNWMARTVQHPAQRGEVAIVLRGSEGIGKGFFVSTFGALWGGHYLHITDPKHLVGSFNAHLRDCVVLFADEAFYAGDKEGNEKLKTLITERTLPIEAKGVDMEVVANFVHVLMASNRAWVIPAGPDARRYFVLDVPGAGVETQVARQKEIAAIDRDLKAGGLENLLHFLLARDVKGWSPLPVPRTAGLAEQREQTLGSEEEWWYGKLVDGTILRGDDWGLPIAKADLLEDYYEYAKAVGVHRRVNATLLVKFLSRACPTPPQSVRIRRTLVGEDRAPRIESVPGFRFPPLAQCRAHWSAHFGSGAETEWRDLDTVEEVAPDERSPEHGGMF